MKLKKLYKAIILASISSSFSSVHGQNEEFPPFVRGTDKPLLNSQAENFYKIIDPLVKKISDKTVVIKVNDDIVSMGTVTNKGIITKFSEISKMSKKPGAKMRMISKSGQSYPVVLKHIYSSYDIAVLENVAKLPAVDLSKSVTPDVGAFIVASGATEQALALGVVSVKPRSLKLKDRGFLGVMMEVDVQEGGGVLLKDVVPDSAADIAGLRVGDVIMSINGGGVNNLLEMKNMLQQKMPGDVVTMNYKRGGIVTAGIKVKLGATNRNMIPRVRRSRMNSMKRMGGRVNVISEGFPQVLQSDIQVKSNFCGSPIIDLDGNFVGVTVAKASRIKTYIIEGKKLDELLKTAPDK